MQARQIVGQIIDHHPAVIGQVLGEPPPMKGLRVGGGKLKARLGQPSDREVTDNAALFVEHRRQRQTADRRQASGQHSPANAPPLAHEP